jgi:recombination protein RecA
MAKRKQLVNKGGGQYFTAPAPISCIPSGCSLLDCVLGGGYAEGRIINIVGDKSTGKTLLAIEACANFVQKYPNAKIHYAEVEAAFDVPYAESLGLPVEQVKFVENCLTVEDVFENLTKLIDKAEKDSPGLYILDSLDALSNRAELKRAIDEGTYGAEKAKKMSELFRRLVQQLKKKNITIIIISQVRDKIGVTFGRKYTRTGGRALDFYASQVIYLSQMGMIKKTKSKVERVVGVNIKVKCTKNKVSMPFRECSFPIIFAFGIDDMAAGVNWLIEVDRISLLGFEDKTEAQKYLRGLNRLTNEEYIQERENIVKTVLEVWQEIEKKFLPVRRKY